MTTTQPRLYQLSEAQWGDIELSFPQRRGQSGFEREIANRDVFEAVLYRLRTGCPWRDLPTEYGPWHTINTRWRRWVKSGVPQRVMVAHHLAGVERGEIDLSLALLDSTIVRAHQHAAGARKKRAASPRSFSRGLEYEDPRGGLERARAHGRGVERGPGW
jgi:transposase